MIGIMTMISMFATIVVMMVSIIKYERRMPPFSILNFIVVIIVTMIAYMLSILNMLSILPPAINYKVGIFATIFYVIAIVSILIVAEGKRAGTLTDAGTFTEKKGFLSKIF